MTTKEELSKQIGVRLTAAREEAGLTRAEVGKQLGLTERGYGHIEAGRSLLSIAHLLELPRILGKPLSYFLPYPNPSQIAAVERLAADPLFQDFMAFWDAMDERQRWTFVEMARHLIGHRSESGESSK